MWRSRLIRAAWATAAVALAPSAAHAALVGPATHGRTGIPAGSRELGAVARNTTVHAAVALQPRDAAGLAVYAQAVSTPGSPLYHRYLNVRQFAERFAPTAAQVAAVRASLRRDGLTPGPVGVNGLSLPVTAGAGTVESAFSTSLRRFALPSGQTGFANTAEPSADPSIAGLVQGIVGLNTLAPTAPHLTVSHAEPRPRANRRTAPAASAGAGSGAGPQACSGARSEATRQASNTTSQIAARYHLSDLYAAGIQGSSVTVAVYELEPFSASDIAAFQSCFHTSAGVSAVRVDGGPGGGGGTGEAAMDVEDVIGLAPGANVRVYEGPASGAGAYDNYARIVSDDVAKVVTTSWGLCESDQGAGTIAAESTLFQEAAVQGQTILASSGDLGSDDCSDHRQAVDDPASQPWVTGVGASSINSTGESAWDNTYGATGGGASQVWARPAYQAASAQPQKAVSCGSAHNSCREVPDVTANGDPNSGYVIYYAGRWNTMGGTSISTPTWAAVAALADSSAACAGHPVGFANPALYSLAASAYDANFGDVTSGANGYDQVAGFSAGSGYDMASGLGTPNAQSLVPALCADSLTGSAQAGAPATSAAASGQSITLARLGARSTRIHERVRLAIRAHDHRGLALRYAATGLPRGLSINPRTGLISGRPQHAGTRHVTVQVTDGHDGLARAGFSWRVRVPAPRLDGS